MGYEVVAPPSSKGFMKIAIILGTRPEIIKMSPVIREFVKRKVDFFILHTNQHYSPNMDEVFFKNLALPPAKYNLNTQESLHGKMTGRMLEAIEAILLTEKPDWTLVEGDTNSVLAGALASCKIGIKVGHIEAGLRSYDTTMPEEINRVLTDHVSSALFCPTRTQADILHREGVKAEKIHITGNTIVDAVKQNLLLTSSSKLMSVKTEERYMLLTLHRPSNVDNQAQLERLINSLEKLSESLDLPIYFPTHPRTETRLKEYGITSRLERIKMLPPVDYLQMLTLEQKAQLILTDSGGVQEEACILHVPCLTLRDNTERPETVEVGANVLCSGDPDEVLREAKRMLNIPKDWDNPFGDGHTAETICDILLKI